MLLSKLIPILILILTLILTLILASIFILILVPIPMLMMASIVICATSSTDPDAKRTPRWTRTVRTVALTSTEFECERSTDDSHVSV